MNWYSSEWDDVALDELLGKTITEINGSVGDERITFTTSDGDKYRMLHYQDCCECVLVEDVIGDMNDLIGSPIVMAQEVSHDANREEVDDFSGTWTFYKFATVNGYVTIRWLGTSNGYYSEGVNFEKKHRQQSGGHNVAKTI